MWKAKPGVQLLCIGFAFSSVSSWASSPPCESEWVCLYIHKRGVGASTACAVWSYLLWGGKCSPQTREGRSTVGAWAQPKYFEKIIPPLSSLCPGSFLDGGRLISSCFLTIWGSLLHVGRLPVHFLGIVKFVGAWAQFNARVPRRWVTTSSVGRLANACLKWNVCVHVGMCTRGWRSGLFV